MREPPAFWSLTEGEAETPDGKRRRIWAWGWSSTDLAQARDVAAERLRLALDRVRAGHDLADYYPSMPLREETLQEVRDPDGTLRALVSRNRYGAEVLSTDRVFIADVDRPKERKAAGGGLLGLLFGRSKGREEAASGQEDPTLQRIRQFGRQHPELGVHVYETKAAATRDWATCRRIDSSGPAPSAEEAELLALHDRVGRADGSLPLA